MPNKKIAIIIVTYNASEYLGELFSSLEKIDYPKDKFEIIVIDNNSNDKSVKMIKTIATSVIARSEAPGEATRQSHKDRGLPRSSSQGSDPLAMTANNKIKIYPIFLKENKGFTGGNNIGIQYAIEKNFDYVYLLNQDTIVDPNFLQEAVKVGESDEKIGAVQSLLMLWPDKDLINSWGNEIHYLGFAYSGGYKVKITDYGLRITDQEIAYASGAACLVKLTALKEIGLFNEDFFMYHEDVDLGWRLWLAGFRVVLAPKSIVYHKYEFQRSIKKYYFMERNRYMALAQNYSFATLLVLLPALCLLDIAMLAYSALGGFWREEIKVFVYFCSIKNWKKIIAMRKIVQSTRKVSDKDIIKHFTGVIAFQDVQSPLVKYILNPIFQAYFFLVKMFVRW